MLENYITGNLVICLISLFILSTFKDIKVNKQLVSEEIIQKDDFFFFFFLALRMPLEHFVVRQVAEQPTVPAHLLCRS